MDFMQSLSGNAVFMIFLTLVLGYALGRINFAGIEFGTSGVLIVALIFGALGMEVPSVIGTAGLGLFLACVGLSAGPTFFSNLKANFWGYIATTAAVLVGASLTVTLAVKGFGLPLDLALGVMAGANDLDREPCNHEKKSSAISPQPVWATVLPMSSVSSRSYSLCSCFPSS